MRSNPGAAPGLEHDELIELRGAEGPVSLTCVDYCPEEVRFQEVQDLDDFLAHHRPEWSSVRWINVDGLSDMKAIHALATKYELHPLAIEDVLHVTQRPKVESYGGEEGELLARLFIVARAIELQGTTLSSEQISIFLGRKTVLSFRERSSDLWEPIRQRLRSKGSRLRANDASFLMHSLLDAIVDRFFPVLEAYSDLAEELESEILEHPDRQSVGAIHQFKRDLLVLHRAAWPMREVVSGLHREPHACMSENTRVYMHDLHDHVIQIMDIIEIYRENASDLTDTYISSASQRMNEIMKVLTIIGTIFIPLTFLAGVYGMNFHHLPELEKAWGYPAFWIVCLAVAGAMLAMFKKRGWL
ncbi:MAG TPA: magnesium/cobalt transporter CorA [Holophaga sp.]|nr:magnesium/cobalt transporter CorA [Holophaga sp.]